MLINGILNKLAPLQFCWDLFKKFYCISIGIWPLGDILWIRIFSYMKMRIYFRLLCICLQTNPSCTDPPTPTHPPKNTAKPRHCQTFSWFNWPDILGSQKQLTFLDTCKMCLITDIYTHNLPHLVQTLYQENLHLQEFSLALFVQPPLHLWL